MATHAPAHKRSFWQWIRAWYRLGADAELKGQHREELYHERVDHHSLASLGRMMMAALLLFIVVLLMQHTLSVSDAAILLAGMFIGSAVHHDRKRHYYEDAITRIHSS